MLNNFKFKLQFIMSKTKQTYKENDLTLNEKITKVIADIKRALNANNDLRSQLALEKEHQLRAFLSAEAAERIAAFVEKR